MKNLKINVGDRVKAKIPISHQYFFATVIDVADNTLKIELDFKYKNQKVFIVSLSAIKPMKLQKIETVISNEKLKRHLKQVLKKYK